MVQALNQVYRATPALWEDDANPAGFEWIDANDAEQSVLSFLRRRPDAGDGDAVACLANLTPVPRYGYRVGLPAPGRWRELLNTDAVEWGGGGVGNYGAVDAQEVLVARASVVGCGHAAAAWRAVADARLSAADAGPASE